MTAARDEIVMIIAAARMAAKDVVDDVARTGIAAWATTLKVPAEASALEQHLAHSIISLMRACDHVIIGTRTFTAHAFEKLAHALAVAANVALPVPAKEPPVPESIPYRPGVED